MNINEHKLARQRIGVNKWTSNKAQGGLQYPTGMGKTFTTLWLVIKPMMIARPSSKSIIVVPTDELRNQWNVEINKLIPEYRSSVFVQTVQWFQSKRLRYDTNLLVLDEVDEYFSSDRKNVWNGTWIQKRWLLWLSATPEDRQQRDRAFVEMYPTVDYITTEEAVENGWVSPYEIYNLAVDLEEDQRASYDYATEQITKNLAKFNNNFEYAGRCLNGYKTKDVNGNVVEYGAFQCATMWATSLGWSPKLKSIVDGTITVADATKEHAAEILEQWTPNHVIGYAKELFRYTRIRKQLLWEASGKIKAFVEVAKYFDKAKIIGFGQSTMFADVINAQCNNEGINSVVYHSNLESQPLQADEAGNPVLFGTGPYITYKKGSKKEGEAKLFGKTVLRRLIIKAFLTDLARVCISASALDKGLNAPGVNLAVITSFTGNPSQFIQRRGRAIRINPMDNNKKAYIVCIYVKNSKEEKTLQRVQASEDSIYWINTIEEIGQQKNSDLDFSRYSI